MSVSITANIRLPSLSGVEFRHIRCTCLRRARHSGDTPSASGSLTSCTGPRRITEKMHVFVNSSETAFKVDFFLFRRETL